MNTHRAYVIYTQYDPQRHKLIASGSAAYCETAADAYAEKYGLPTAVIEVDRTPSGLPKIGDPHNAEWPVDRNGNAL